MFSVRRDGSEMRQLIKPRRDFIRAICPSRRETLDWNHDLLAVPRDGSGEVIVGAHNYTNRSELDSVSALRLDVATGRTRTLSLARPAHVMEWLFDPKGGPASRSPSSRA